MKRTLFFSFFAWLGGVFLVMSFLDGPWAQEDDNRAARIRSQMGVQAPAQTVESALQGLRQEINSNLAALSVRLDTIEKNIVDLKTRLRVLEVRTEASGKFLETSPVSPANIPQTARASAPAIPPQTAPALPPQTAPLADRSMISVCASGCDASSLLEAAKQISEGGTISLEPGDYVDCLEITKSFRLVGKIGKDGGRAHLKKRACGGKGAIIVEAPKVTIEGLKISGIQVPDRNGACIRVGPGSHTLLIKDIHCSDSQDGLLGSTSDGGQLTIENSTFENNGFGGQAHDIYINGGQDAVLRNVRILASDDGHLLKSGAMNLLVENSVIAALNGNSGRALDIYGGGKLTVRNSVIQLGPKTQNHDFIGYALELDRIVSTAGNAHEIVIENNWIIYDDSNRCCRWLFNGSSNILGTISFRNNYLVGKITPNIRAVNMRLNKEFADREEAGLGEYDGTLASLPKPGSVPAKAD